MITREEVVRKLNISDLSLEEQDEQLQQLADTVSSRLLQKITEKLSDDDIDHLSELIDEGKDEEVEAYLRSKVEDFDTWNEKIELDTINELESNRKAITAEIDAIEDTVTPTD